MPTSALLIYNPNARSTQSVALADLEAALYDAGYDPVSHATESEHDLDPILAGAEGLVVAVGGDGTLRAVATRLVDTGVPIAIVPLGTANNVARTLGLTGRPTELLKALVDPRKIPYDVGRVRHPWGTDYFLEATGCGIFADVLYRYEPAKGKSVLRAVGTLREVLATYRPRDLQVQLDGEDLSGEHLGLEVLNAKATGPRLKLAPDADPSDGLLDVVRVLPTDEVPLLAYAGRLLSEAFVELPNVEVRRGRRLEIAWNGDPLHVDEELRPLRDEARDDLGPLGGMKPTDVRGSPGRIEVEVMAGALEMWLPAAAPDEPRDEPTS